MSWRDPKWVYQPAATHGDSQAFAQRQRERMTQAWPMTDPVIKYYSGVARAALNRQIEDEWPEVH